jgi:hypothetical protein
VPHESVRCVCDDPAPCGWSRHKDIDQLSHVPGNGHYRVSIECGKLEVAQQMAAHESACTTGLYDRRGDDILLDEVERIVI